MLQRTTHRLMRLSLLLFSVVLVACNGGSTQPAGAALPTTDSATVNVTAKDFSYTLDQTAIRAGTITFTVQNAGTMAHDFVLEVNGVEQKTPLLDPGQSATLKVTLSPGTYNYRCTVPGHDILGMKGTLTVNSGSD